MRSLIAFYGALAALALAAAPLAGQRAPTLHDWISLAAADGPSISPDGKSVAYLMVTPDWSKDDFHREIWIATAEGGERRQLTREAVSSWAPRWSPDGKWLSFLSSRGNGTQLYLVRLPNGAPMQLTTADGGVDDYRWAPNGRQIAFLSGEAVSQPAPEPKEFHLVGNDGQNSAAVWVVDVPAEPSTPVPAVRVTDPRAFVADEISWSPDGKRIAIHANSYDAPYPFWTYDIYVVDLASKTARRIVETPGPDFFPIWSPDGSEIAYRSYIQSPEEEYYSHTQGYVAVVPAAGGPPRILTSELDEQATPLAWTADGIWFSARQGTFQHLFRVDPTTKAIRRISDPFRSVSTGFSFTPDGRNVAFVWSDSTHYQEVFSSPVGASLAPRRLTTTGEQLAGWTLASREIISWKSKDGTPIEGVLFKPPRLDPSSSHPLVVIAHGGPLAVDQAAITRDLPYVAELYAQRGFLVLRPNYRGSVGYGARFRAALIGNLGAKEYEDVVGGVDLLVHQGLADSSRVGLMGWSHGGYIAAFASTYGDRFAAISVGATVSDMRLFYSLGAGSTLKPSLAAPTPWDEPDYFRRVAPITYVKQARTPTLIQHGERDNTAPIAGAHELYRGLKDQGVPVRMIVYRGAGHLPSGLKQFEAVAEHNLDWFGRRLWNVPRQGAARQVLKPCVVPALDTLVTLCATIPVRENRSVPNSRMLGLRVVVVPPDSGAELPDPIVPVPGGPGGGTIGSGNGWARALKGARGHRALILIDPRGAARSGALECDFSDGPDRPGSQVQDFAPPAKVRACADSLSRRADLSQYHTATIAEDLAEVLTALGYDRVNLYGVSGGTRQAFVFAQRYPTRVRSLILAGVVPPGFKLPLHYGEDFDRSLDLLLADCARDRDCHAAYPDPRGDLARVLASLARAPARIAVPVPGGGSDTARVTRDIFAERIRTMLYSSSLAATVPYVIHRAAQGDYMPFVEPMVNVPRGGDGIATGHYLSVTCSEDVDRITGSERRAAARGTLLGDYRVQQQVDACKLWPHARLPEAHFQARTLDIPALLISGDADPVTPPRWAEGLKKYLPSARHVVFPTGWHVPFGTPCATALASRFILAGDARGVDFSCAATLARPPFRLP